jgi:hypothetical protein
MKQTLVLLLSVMIFIAGSFILLFAEDSVPVAAKAGTEVQADSNSDRAIAGEVVDSSRALPVTDHKLVVYYFHGNQRCSNCLKIEAYTKEAIDSNANKHYRDDYQLYTKSVILSDLHNGKEVRWKNLDKVWEYLGDKAAFKNYIREEVAAYLKDH